MTDALMIALKNWIHASVKQHVETFQKTVGA